jgi:spore germination protein YaaH/flagellar hook assembly protein FlgD
VDPGRARDALNLDPSTTSAPPPPIPAPPPPDPTGPSIIAQEAAAHADDRIAFTPGAQVTVPFVPRVDDGWVVGGGAPKTLPAGAASGRAMAASRQGTVWTPSSRAPQAGDQTTISDALRPVDGPSLSPGEAFSGNSTSAVVRTTDPVAPSAGTGLRRQVFGFLPYWELSSSSTTLHYEVLSTIAYFGVGAKANGDLIKHNADGSTSVGWSGWTSSRLTSIINAAHRSHARVVLTVQAFAWSSTQAASQSALLGSPSARLNLARQIAAAVRDRGADGVNLDFEPIVSGRADEFTAFVRTLRGELDAIARGYQLTFDTTGYIGNYPIEDATAPGGADAIFVMGYDYRTASASAAGSVAPLGGPAYDLTDTALAYLARVPASKLILGIPYYGRAWSTTSDAPNATTQSGIKYGPSVPVNYDDVVDLAQHHGRRYDTTEQSAWFAYQRQNCSASSGCVTSWREVYYDDAQSLRAKYDMIDRLGLRGAGIWALGYDGTRPELYRALADKFLHDTTAPETGISILAPQQGDEGFAVGWSAVDWSGIRNYDVQVSADGGPWTAWLTRSTGTSAVYLGHDGHAYAFRARATDAKGNVGAWDIATLPSTTSALTAGGFATVSVDTLSVRGRPTTAGSIVDRLTTGDIVALTDGPVSADGYTWYQITGPLTTWGPTVPVWNGNWIAVRGSGSTYATARMAPNSTVVQAGISGLSFGDRGAQSLGPAPSAVAARTFSPNGDGSRDTLAMRWQNHVALDSLALNVLGADGSVAGTVPVAAVATGAQTWTWDGKVGGVALPDGRYMVQLVGKAGATTYASPSARPATPEQTALFGVTIDTVAPTMTAASVSPRAFSPNGDDRLESVAIKASGATGASSWRFTAAPLKADGPGAPVRTIAGSGAAPKLNWDGRTDAGTVAGDGTYRLTIAVLDDAGNAATRTFDVVLDTTPPAVTVASSPTAFSPDGDGTADRTKVAWTNGDSLAAVVTISRGTKVVRTFTTKAATAGTFAWDGRDRTGRPVADGAYTVRIVSSDAVGNRGVAAVAVTVDRSAGFLRWSPIAFDPQDGDALARSARVTFRLGRTATTTLAIVDGSGAVVRTIWADRRLPAGTFGWSWDGRNGLKASIAPGTYSAVLTATSDLGTSTLRRAIVVDAFVVSSSATTLSAGQVLTVAFTTVEPLKSRPVVTFTQPGAAPVKQAATLVSTGRYTVSFTVAAGTAGDATLQVAARDAAGGLNVSTRTLAVR